MTSFQKVIKYGAIAFGIYLCFSIISMIVFGLTAFIGIGIGFSTYDNQKNITQQSISAWEETYQNVENLEIQLSVSRFRLVKGRNLKISVKNETTDFSCKMEGNTLKIKENKNFHFNTFSENNIPEVILYVPEDMTFNNIEIKSGVNEFTAEILKGKNVKISSGVGKYAIDYLVADTVKFEGGAGYTIINDSEIGTLKLQAGVGKIEFNGKIMTQGKIKAGVGNLVVNLIGTQKDYSIRAKTGLGTLRIDGTKIRDNQLIGNGKVDVKVEAGVGSTTVDFMEESAL